MTEFLNGQELYIAHDGNPITLFNAGDTVSATITQSGSALVLNDPTALSLAIAGVNRVATTATEHTIQVAVSSQTMHLDTYSDTLTARSVLRVQKSHSDTLGTSARTLNGEYLGQITVAGFTATPTLVDAFQIRVLQNGATAARVPGDAYFETSSAAALNTDQFVLRNDGTIEFNQAAGLIMAVTNDSVNLLTTIALEFGDPGRSIVDNGTDVSFLNATNDGDILLTASGTTADIILDSTRLVELDAGVNAEIHIAGVNRVSVTATTYTNQYAGGPNDLHLDSYSANNADRSRIFLRKSNNNTLGVLTETTDTDSLGAILFQGIDNGSNFDTGARIEAIQNGAAGSRLPTDVKFETYTSSAINTEQFVLRSTGDVEFNKSAGLMNVALRCFSTTAAEFNYISINKSASATIGTLVETVDTDVLGRLYFQGVDTGTNLEQGAYIEAKQNGAAGTYVPTDLKFFTANDTGLNTVVLNLKNDNTIEMLDERVIHTQTTFTRQGIATDLFSHFSCYSATAAETHLMQFNKSASATLGTGAETGSGEVLAKWQIMGVGSGGSNFVQGATILFQQSGAAGANFVPTDISFATWSATAGATWFVIRNDGDMEFRGGSDVEQYDSTNNDKSYSRQMPALATADATQTTIDTVTLDDNHAYLIKVEGVAMENDGSGRRSKIMAGTFYRDGGGATQEGATTSIHNEGSDAVLFDFTVNGNDVRVSVTGIAAEDWDWTGRLTVVELD